MALQRTAHRFKLVMLGDSTVGKTALITRFVQNHFTELMPATIGAHFQKQTLIVDDEIITLDGRWICIISTIYFCLNSYLVFMFHSNSLGYSWTGKVSSIEVVLMWLLIIFMYSNRFRSLIPMYYRGTDAAIVVYDIQNRNSFGAAKKWIDQLRDEVNIPIQFT